MMTVANLPEINSDRIQDTLYAFTRSQILFTALDLNVFTCIANGHNTISKVAEHLHIDKRGCRILLEGLIGIGFLDKDGDIFTLAPDAQEYLVKESPYYLGGMVTHCKRLYENWGMLTDAVRHGTPVGGAQSLAQLEAYFAELVRGLYVSNYPTAQHLAEIIGIGKDKTGLNILDVAGGSGVWSIAMLERDKSSKTTLLDFPTVISVAKEYVEQHHLQENFNFWAEDLEEADYPKEEFDLAVLGNICHALGPYATERLILNMGQTVKPGGTLAIVDFVPDNNRSKAGWPLIFGVNMLISTPEGDVFTESQYSQWFKKAGFTEIKRIEIEHEVSVILGTK